MLPVAAAIGGMAVPAVMYTMLVPTGPEGSEGAWRWGWGVPMATDTAFAVALIAMMGRRVPVELRVFLTAAAIVDDIGAILVVAAFYTDTLQAGYLAGATAITGLLTMLNRAAIYRPSPYVLLGIGLWVCVYSSGVHASLAGVVLALFIPTRPPPNIKTLMLQADAILSAEMKRGREVMRYGPSVSSLEALDAIHDRLESPAERMLRYVAPRSSYLVLPLFALANAGVELDAAALAGREALMLGTAAALVAGKPLGFIAATLLAAKLGIAAKPRAYTWRQLAGAGALAGIGFTMSLFIAGQAFHVEADFAAAKIAIFVGSVLSALAGTAILWFARIGPPDSQPERASAK
jgi:NhaA family Na+:H+ antiporter